MVELSGDLIAEQPSSATWTDSPGINVFGVAPHQIAECSLVRNLLGSGDDPDLINSPDLRTEAAVHTQNGPIDNGSEDKEVEYLAASLPHRGVAILCLTFLIEPVDLGDLPGLVVPSDEHDSIRIPELGQPRCCMPFCALSRLTLP